MGGDRPMNRHDDEKGTDIEIDEVVRLYDERKWSVRDIADRFGCSYGRIYRILRTHAVMRKPGSPRQNVDRLQITAIMHRHIITGDWKPNHKLLGEQELAMIFGVGPRIIRRAIADLRARGYLLTTASKGTYVRPRCDWPPMEDELR
jgi:GntR family transcriptional regulator